MTFGDESLQRLVKLSLFEFVNEHFPSASLDCIDEILLSYIAGVLEDVSDLGSNPTDEDALDIDGLMETLDAYIPDFGRVGSAAVRQWLLSLSSVLADKRSECGRSTKVATPGDSCDNQLSRQLEHSVNLSSSTTNTSKTSSSSLGGSESVGGNALSSSQSSTLQSSSETSVNSVPVCQEVLSTLAEMFPDTCTTELLHCYSASAGVADRAIQLLLARQEAGQSLTDASQPDPARRRQQRAVLDDAALKQQLLDKYSYQDVDDAKKHHRPQLPKSSPKKLVRYLDSKVVSVKGERFTEIKRPETEEMKKTYVNLKPQRQYRFH